MLCITFALSLFRSTEIKIKSNEIEGERCDWWGKCIFLYHSLAKAFLVVADFFIFSFADFFMENLKNRIKRDQNIHCMCS